jgi:hypothetical protein
MADFIAVIRRAVDGLSENTPEMRVKVYERARAAVVRQLENMKPRPPELMFQRQLDKLDAAIREVEAEHAEAMPADDVADEAPSVVPEPVAEIAPEPEPGPVAFSEPEPAPQPAESEVEPAAHLEESAPEPATGDSEPTPEPVTEPVEEPVAEVEAEPEHHSEPETVVPAYVMPEASAEEPMAHLEPEAHPAQIDVQPYETVPEVAKHDEAIPAENEAEETHSTPAETVYQPFAAPAVEAEPIIPEAPAEQTIVSEPKAETPAEEPRQWAVEVDEEPETVVADPTTEEPTAAVMPRVSYDETDVVAGFNDFLKEEMNRKVVPPPPARKPEKQDDFSWDAPFDDLPEIPKPVSFEKALEAKQKEIAADAANQKAQPKTAPISARAELEDLIGLDRDSNRALFSSQDGENGDLPPDVTRAVSKLEGKSFKVHKKNKKHKGRFKLLPIALGLAVALVLAGGGYALWLNKDNLSEMAAGIMPAGEAEKPAEKPVDKTSETAEEPAADTKTTESAPAEKQTEVASLDTDSGPQKFTQRLLPDGSESETDAAQLSVDETLPEGKTLAGQTDKGKQVAETETTTNTQTNTTDTTPAQTDAQPLGVTQKMFLYEERLGQSSPVAVPGTIVWKEKADTENGKPNPSIEAQIEIPQRNIKALLSIKRNTDASLPASHIIEIVFALPKDFEEGNIESVQRVAFKQTEQDRGNPLIAVPAKITDDFHMVALNDDADARKVNLELMKTRGWIDIPITYRNGRRALITLEKGTSGTAVFDKVMGEWAALGQQSSN